MHFNTHFEPIMVDIWLIYSKKCDILHFYENVFGKNIWYNKSLDINS